MKGKLETNSILEICKPGGSMLGSLVIFQTPLVLYEAHTYLKLHKIDVIYNMKNSFISKYMSVSIPRHDMFSLT